MKNNVFFIGLFAIMLFVFGCAMPGGSPPSTTPAPSSTVAQPQPQPLPAPQPTPQPTPAPAPSPVSDFSNKGYEELVALGAPVECNVKVTSSSGQQNMKLYVKGKNFKVEMDTPETPECSKAVTIFKDKDAMYMSCGAQEILPQCKWLKISIEGVDTSQPDTPTYGSGSVSSSDLGEIPKTDFSCKAGTFTDAIFTPSGKICDLTELTKGLDTGGLDYGSLPTDSGSDSGSSSGDTSTDITSDAPPAPE